MEITGLKTNIRAVTQEPMLNTKGALNTEAGVTKLTPTDTVSISKEAMTLLNSEGDSYTPLSAGGTTLPAWPPKKQN